MNKFYFLLSCSILFSIQCTNPSTNSSAVNSNTYKKQDETELKVNDNYLQGYYQEKSKKSDDKNKFEQFKVAMIKKGAQLISYLKEFEVKYKEECASQPNPEPPLFSKETIQQLISLGPDALSVSFTEYASSGFKDAMKNQETNTNTDSNSEATGTNGKNIPMGVSGVIAISSGLAAVTTAIHRLATPAANDTGPKKIANGAGLAAGLGAVGGGIFMAVEGFKLAETCSANENLKRNIVEMKKDILLLKSQMGIAN